MLKYGKWDNDYLFKKRGRTRDNPREFPIEIFYTQENVNGYTVPQIEIKPDNNGIYHGIARA